MSDNAKYKHLFIAYASKDQAAHNTLLSHLNVLKKEIPITLWSEADLMPGAEIQKETQAELQRADIVLLLVSNDSLNSEAYKNIQSQVRASTTFVPVLLRACMWESDPFLKDLKPLPSNRQYISQADDEDAAYTKIAQEVKKIVVGEVEDMPFVSPVNQSSFWKRALLVSLLLIGGLWLVSSLFNSEVEALTDDVTPDEPSVSTTIKPEYGNPIFTTDTSLFKILIIRFEDNLNEDDDTYCIGRSILENFIQLKTKELLINPIYADTIASPKYPEDAEHIQQHHNADVLIYGLANEIQENCTAANVCFRHVIANTIMANLGIQEDKRIKHDAEYERMSHSDIEKGKLSIAGHSMEGLANALLALKKGDKEIYYAEIEKIAIDIAHLKPEEQAIGFHNQGVIFYDSGDYDKAIESYTKAIELNINYIEAYNNRGISYRYLKEYEKAIADINKAIELKPNYANAYHYRGICYNDSGDYEKAIADHTKAIELKPDYANAYNGRGIYYTYLEDYEKAIVDYEKAIELRPDYPNAYNNIGIVYDKLEDYEKAIESFNKAIESKSDYADAYNARGVIYGKLKEYEKEMLDYNKAIELEPDYARAYFNRGVSYNELKDYKKAILNFDKAIELKPDHTKAYYNRGVSYDNLKEYKKAITDYKKVLQLEPSTIVAYIDLMYSFITSNFKLIIFFLVLSFFALNRWWKKRKKN